MNFIKQYWISICIGFAVFYLCFMNTSNLPEVEVHDFDKFVHSVMTMGLSMIIFFDQTSYFKRTQLIKNILIATWLIPVIYTGGIEILQEFVSPNRTGDWMDFWASLIGAMLGFIANYSINKHFLSRKNH